MTAFPDHTDATPLTRAALAYHIATGRESLTPHADAVKWALEHADPLGDPRDVRAVEAMIPWLDDVVDHDVTRERLGLELYPCWYGENEYGVRGLLLERATIPVAIIDETGWSAYHFGSPNEAKAGEGSETGTAGMDAAEAALRRAGVLAEGVTVRRAVTP